MIQVVLIGRNILRKTFLHISSVHGKKSLHCIRLNITSITILLYQDIRYSQTSDEKSFSNERKNYMPHLAF